MTRTSMFKTKYKCENNIFLLGGKTKFILRERTLEFGKTEPIDKHPETTVIVWVHLCLQIIVFLPWNTWKAEIDTMH